jgi:hypothetical protein
VPRSLLAAAALLTAAVLGFAYDVDPKPPASAPVAPAAEAAVAPQPMSAYEGALPPGHPPIDQHPAEHADGPAGPLPAGHPPIDFARLDGARAEPVRAVAPLSDGVTIARVIGDAASYEGKRVRIAAKIVKRTENVLGRTWLHLQDGSGDAQRGDHDLVVTTESAPEIGVEVVVEGVVQRNKDLGSGYRYDVLIEDAAVSARQAD